MNTHMSSPSWSPPYDAGQTAESLSRHANTASDLVIDNPYFDPLGQLADSAFDDLINTFDHNPIEKLDNISDLPSPPSQKPQQSPSPALPSMEAAMNGTSPSSSSSGTSSMQQQRYHGMPVHPPSAYGPNPMAPTMLPPAAFHHNMIQQQSMPLQYLNNEFSNTQGYQAMNTVVTPPNGYYYHSPPIQYDSRQPSPSPYYPASRQGTAGPMDCGNVIAEDVEGEAEVSDPCYAQLLYRCLQQAENHTLSLKELYEWVEKNSLKANDKGSKGWQNSVRHNLSMNAAFERVSGAAGTSTSSKKGSLWRLTTSALQNGVISTTRYRKDPKRKPERRSSPAIKRQISGAKGGQATKLATAHRRAVELRSAANARATPRGYRENRLGALERHNRQNRHQDFGPTSVPGSASASPAFPPRHVPGAGAVSGPSSPFYLPPTETPSWAVGTAYPVPHSPTEMTLGNYGDNTKAAVPEFSFAPYQNNLFGNHDGLSPETPSLATEASFYSTEDSPPFGMNERATSEGVLT